MQCRAPGCLAATYGYSTYCQNHKQKLRRHGAPTQDGITVHELRPYVTLVETRKAKNPTSEAWAILVARWDVVQDNARATLQRFAEGRAGNRVERLAAHHLVKVGQSVEPWVVIKTALGLFILQEQQPARFTNDAAFDFQLVRRVRGLTDSNAGAYWDHNEQRSKRVYRDIPPRVIQAMAHPLKAAFGTAGLMLAAKERQDIAKASDERRRLTTALEVLQ
ncbi:hypothetical protein [Rhodoferax sp. U11-2br]|uniref:hypothetical protein n=1 Tax=Rhodoferax sp. U11-2br TaxID=2838878 RepID=UPI001BE7DF47|nr:hypothetical protein [Rhodoferax sp. U11-2br]MBT3066579.1 hypothetical protein [Rhodoferax sp. U11-2br]